MFINIVITVFSFFVILFFLNKFSKKVNDKHQKYILLFYNVVKTIFILLISIFIYNMYDINNFIGKIPKDNMSINITIYSAVQSLLLGFIELLYVDNKTELVLKLYIKNDRDISKDPLIIRYDEGAEFREKFYLSISYSGNRKLIKATNVLIKFPKTLIGQVGTSLFLNNDQTLVIPLEKHLTIDREDRKEIPIDIMIRVSDQGNSMPPILSAQIDKKHILLKEKNEQLSIEYK